MLSPAQWRSSVQPLQLASLCLYGTYLNCMTAAVVLKYIFQLKYVTETFSLYNDIARCLPPTLVPKPHLGAGYIIQYQNTCSGAGYVVHDQRV